MSGPQNLTQKIASQIFQQTCVYCIVISIPLGTSSPSVSGVCRFIRNGILNKLSVRIQKDLTENVYKARQRDFIFSKCF